MTMTKKRREPAPTTPPLPAGLPAPRLTDNARQVLVRRYVRRGEDGLPAESVEEMFWRVAYHVAKVEDQWQGNVDSLAEAYYALLTSKRFFPNSPTFTGAGTPLGQLAACFVLPITDDMGRDPAGIFQTLRDAALIQQTGGGNGFSFSRLRPKGSLVKSSAGQATGPVGFLRVYDHAFGEVAQGGSRRGANMAVLRVDHPDVEDFIASKTNENAITNFNISVGITDAFMRAVDADEDWTLRFPDVHHPAYRDFEGTIDQSEAAGVPLRGYKTMRARDLFNQIVTQAHHNGEPGVLFLDAANRSNPVPHLYALEATNPCFTGETRISTEAGLLTIREMAEQGLDCLIATDERSQGRSGLAFRRAVPAWKTRENTPVMRLVTREGYRVTATPDHRFLTPDRGYVALQDLQPGDCLLLQPAEGAWNRSETLPVCETAVEAAAAVGQITFANRPGGRLPDRWSHELGFMLGALTGSGWLSPRGTAPVGINFASQSSEAVDLVSRAAQEWFGSAQQTQHPGILRLTLGRPSYQFFEALGVQPVPAHLKRVPSSVWQAPRPAVIGFLQGLFTSAGSVELSGNKRACSIRLIAASRGLLEDTQLLLLNLGIASRLHPRRTAAAEHPAAQTGFELILNKANRDLFLEKVGFIDSARQQKAQAFINSKSRRSNVESFTARVERVEAAGSADVYDLTEPATNSLIANGLVAHNCGEQWLGAYENCCLGSVNLAEHFGPDGSVDWEGLRQSVALSTRFLDDVVDANKYVPSVPQLSEAAHRARRIGLGIMGLGDLMYHAGIRYGSKEGQAFASQVMEFVRYHAMITSIDLARERGPFPAISGSIYDPQNLVWTPPNAIDNTSHNWGRPPIDWQAVVDGIHSFGIRNAAQTTIAPTGTIATVAGCEGYGCEPVFALAYIRHVNDNGKDLQLTYTSPQFERALEKAGFGPEQRQAITARVMAEGSCQGIAELPISLRDTFVVSQDITAEEHVYMQAAMQAFVDNSLSKTINFPPDATPEDVAEAYLLAWKLGCKGITVYVTGSREKVVLETHATAQKKQERKNGSESAAEKPCPEPDTSEQIELWHEPKKPRPRALPGYTFSVETPLGKAFITINENGGSQPFEVFINTAKAGSETAAVSEAIGRLVSYILRMSSPIEPRERLSEVVRQLAGIGGGRSLGFGPHRVRSLPDGVAQILEEYIRQREERLAAESDRPANGNGHEPAVEAVEPLFTPQPLRRSMIGDLCPECGEAAVVNEEGCRKCYACGFSEC